MLRPDIVEMLEGLRDADPNHDVVRCLNSNGLLVTSALARRLAGLADEVRISLDGFERQNDALRGNGNFAAATKALHVYREAGLNPKILITVTRQTLPDLEEFLMFLVGRGFTSINVNWFRPIGRGKGHNDWCVRGADIKHAIRRAFSRLGAHPTSPGGTVETDSQYHCGVGRFLNIMPNGDVFPCHVLTNPEFRCGNVKTQNLLDICRQNGLLGQLGNLDFRVLANEEPAVAELTKADTCFGSVYAEKHRLNVWRNHLTI